MQKVNKSLIWLMVAIMVFVASLSLLIFAVGMQEFEKTQIAVGDGEAITEGEVCDMPSELVFLSSVQVGQSVRVEANVYPLDATFRQIGWKATWNESDTVQKEWAQGKDIADYLKLEENDTVCSITYQQSFGCRIDLTAYSKDDPSKKAVCAVDIVRPLIGCRINYVYAYLGAGGSTEDLNGGLIHSLQCNMNGPQSKVVVNYSNVATPSDFREGSSRLMFTPEYGVGTLTDECDISGSLEPNEQFDTALSQISSSLYLSSIAFESFTPFFNDDTINQLFHCQGDSVMIRKVRNLLATTDYPHFYYVFRVSGRYSKYVFEFPVQFDSESVKVLVNSVVLNQTQLVFGG